MNGSLGTDDLIIPLLIVLAVGMTFIGGCAIYYGRKITSKRIPMQWGEDGRPTWLAPRLVGIWFSFCFTLIVSAFLFVLAFYETKEKLPWLGLSIATVIVTNMVVQRWHLRRVLWWQSEADKAQQ
jgi:hypothetical protein